MQDFEIQDDMQLDSESPRVETGPKPPLPGNYLFKILKWQYRSNKDGTPLLYKNASGVPTYPVIGLTTAEITDPIDNARKVVLFQDVSSVPFDRAGKQASRAGDLLVAIDAAVTAGNTGEILRELASRLNAGLEFKARLDYEAYDKDAAATAVAKLGANPTKQAVNKAYQTAKVRGFRNILKSNNLAQQGGLPLHKWVGPSGNVVDVRPVLTVFYPSDINPKEVVLGADKNAAAHGKK
jgi:hypothetical protein